MTTAGTSRAHSRRRTCGGAAGRLDPRYIGRTEAHVPTLRFDWALDDVQGDAMLVADGGLSIRTHRRCSQPGRLGPPTWRRRLKPAALTSSGACCDASRVSGRHGTPAVGAARPPATGDEELRLRTTQEIYWDCLAVVYAATATTVETHSMPLVSARLASVGSPAGSYARGADPCSTTSGARRSRTRATREASIPFQAPSPSWSRPRTARSPFSVPARKCSSHSRRRFRRCGPAGRADRARGSWMVQGHGSRYERWRDRRAAAGHTRADRGRTAAPLHHTVRVRP